MVMQNHHYKSLMLDLSTILGVTTLIGGILASSYVFAEDNTSVVDEVSITVPISCTMSGTGMNTHNAEIVNGTYTPDIGSTTLHAFCNDSEGFAIYAAGYTNNEVGGENSNKLVGSAASNNAIIESGIATTAGNPDVSNWAMKLAIAQDSGDTAGANAFTIDSAPNIALPSQAESGVASAPFSSYHLVPNEYAKVAHKNSMTDMTESTGGVKLTTTYAAYISKTQPADTYTGQVKYVLVHPSDASAPSPFYGESMQTVAKWNTKVAMGQTVTVPDARDGTEYTVARLADGRLWMTKNLRLNLGTAYDKITVENTNNPTQAFLDELAINHGPTNTGDWGSLDYDRSQPGNYKNTIRYNDQEIGDMTVDDWGNTHDEYGIYYNWYTATAGNGNYEMTDSSGPAAGDLCPSGWHLPTGQPLYATTNSSEYGELFIALGGPKNSQGLAMVASSDSSPTGFEMAERFRAAPNNYVMAGMYWDGQIRYPATEYWTSLSYLDYKTYTLGLGRSRIDGSRPGITEYAGYKYTGHAMRCIADRLSFPLTINYAPGIVSVSVDGEVVRDGESISLEENTSHRIEAVLEDGYAIEDWQTTNGIISDTTITTANFKMELSPSTITLSTTTYPLMQNVAEWGINVEQGETVEAMDVRDRSIYTIARLADDKLWMTKNLRLNLAEANITAQNTNNPSAGFIDSSTSSAASSSDSWCESSTSSCIDQIEYSTENLGNMTVGSDGHAYDEYGVYYNWYTATAGNGTYATASKTIVSGDICPSGWRLPTGTPTDVAPWEWTGDYWELSAAFAGLKLNEITVDNYGRILTSENNSKIKTSPNNFLLSGISGNGFGEVGFYWTAQSSGNGRAYSLVVNVEQTNSPLGSAQLDDYNGEVVRCLAK